MDTLHCILCIATFQLFPQTEADNQHSNETSKEDTKHNSKHNYQDVRILWTIYKQQKNDLFALLQTYTDFYNFYWWWLLVRGWGRSRVQFYVP